jgi:hypothetical protein
MTTKRARRENLKINNFKNKGSFEKRPVGGANRKLNR